MPPAKGGCEACGKPGPVCDGCQSACYCSGEHQKLHRLVCGLGLPFEVRNNKTLGRHLVATRHIHRGDVVFKELPLVFGPDSRRTTHDDGTALSSCTSCCRILNPNASVWVRCSRCQWPMCSVACQDSSVHVPECSLLTEKRVRPGSSSESITSKDETMIFVVRCLLANEVTAGKIRELQAGTSLHLTPSEKKWKNDEVQAILNVVETLNISPDDVRRVHDIINTNAFDMYSGYGKVRGTAIYYFASFMSHSCVPNAEWALSDDSNIEMVVKAMENIRPGEVISTVYVHLSIMTCVRNDILLRDQGFQCYCKRCRDPTELGSFVGSICCEECKDNGKRALVVGVPSKAKKAENFFPEWRCQDCKTYVPVEAVYQYHHCAEEMTKLLDDDMKIKILQYPEGQLHPGNSKILRCKWRIVTKIMKDLRCNRGSFVRGGFTPSTQDLRRVVSLSRDLLDGYARIIPALSQVTGLVYLKMHIAMAELLRRRMHFYMSSRVGIAVVTEGNKEPAEMLKDIAAAEVELETTVKILRHLADYRDVLKQLRHDIFVMRRVWVWTSAALQFCNFNQRIFSLARCVK